MHESLAALVALQRLDSAADQARRRAAELPAVKQALDDRVAAAAAAGAEVKTRLSANHQARLALDKDIAVVDARLARFEDHKAAVKTNQEYKALLHEVEIAKKDKDAIEEKILELMEAADGLTAEEKAADAAHAEVRREADQARVALAEEARTLDTDLARLADERRREAKGVDGTLLAKYDQLLKGRRGVAVAAMTGEICSACHVRLRPHIAQQVRKGDSIVQCDSCQRILYYIEQASVAS